VFQILTLYDEDLIPIKVCDSYNPELDIINEVFDEKKSEWINYLSCNSGSDLTFKITIKNSALDQLTDIEITDYLPVELRYIQGSSDVIPTYESQSNIIWNINQMNPDEEIEITYQVEAIGSDICSNNAIATAFINTFQFNDTDNVLIDIKDPPIVHLSFPTGGEELQGNIRIQWFSIDSGCNPEIWLYYSNDGGSTWNEIARELRNTIGQGARKDRGEYIWNTNALPNGNYMIKIKAYDTRGNKATDESNLFCIGTRASGVLVSYVNFDSNISYIKNGDSIEIQAGVTFGSHISKDYVTANLLSLGKGENIPADSFDGLTAKWFINNIVCTPSDGLITVMITATDGATTGINSATIIADNTQPELEVIKPENGFYIKDNKVFIANKPIIFGPITIEAKSHDLSDINKIELYIDNKLIETQPSNLNCYMNLRLMGKHKIKIIAYDNAGNTNEYSQMMNIFNPFGEK